MAVQPSDTKHLNTEIISVKGECSAGHKAGDRLQISMCDEPIFMGYIF